jgi:hypothetical protein
MGRIRCVVSIAAFISTLSLFVVEARAITLPDTSSPCSTGSADGCLKIQNTDTSDFGAPAISAISQSPFSTAINANGNYYGITATGGGVGVQGSGASAGVYGSSGGTGVVGSSSSGTGTGVYGTASGSNGIGVYGNASGGGYAVKATASGYGTGIQASGYTAVSATGGNVGISASGGVYGVSASSANIGVYGSSSGSGSAIYGSNTNSTGYAGYFDGRVFSTSIFFTSSWSSSDARLKQDIVGLTYGLKDLSALRPVAFKWKDPSRGDGRNIGFVAQEVRKVFPEVVNQDAKSGMLSINYPALVPVLVKSIQEQQAIIVQQEARIQALEQRPIVSSMFSGGINLSVALGALGALLLTVVRRRKSAVR